jgi:GTP cyclohydrolase II
MKHIDQAKFPSRYGNFTIHLFVDNEGREHVALVRCTHGKHEGVPVRIHSKCLTGDTLASLRCDCRQQLESALEYLEKEECGVLLYLDQEGRGIGLTNKIKAYALQDKGLDTVEANLHLGFSDDLRDYSIAADILKYFGVKSISLLTNNPDKVKDLEEHGIKVVKRIPLVMEPTEHNEKYLKTKKEKLHHEL